METRKPANVRPALPPLGPESRLFEVFKGKSIWIFWKNGAPEDRATLLWVDRYTIGVRTEQGNEQMIYKDGILKLELARS